MPVIDVQVHPFDRNHPGRPWASPSHGLDAATGEEMIAAMNSVGVDGAIMASSPISVFDGLGNDRFRRLTAHECQSGNADCQQVHRSPLRPLATSNHTPSRVAKPERPGAKVDSDH